MSYETDVALYERDYVKESHTICQSWTLRVQLMFPVSKTSFLNLMHMIGNIFALCAVA